MIQLSKRRLFRSDKHHNNLQSTVSIFSHSHCKCNIVISMTSTLTRSQTDHMLVFIPPIHAHFFHQSLLADQPAASTPAARQLHTKPAETNHTHSASASQLVFCMALLTYPHTHVHSGLQDFKQTADRPITWTNTDMLAGKHTLQRNPLSVWFPARVIGFR